MPAFKHNLQVLCPVCSRRGIVKVTGTVNLSSTEPITATLTASADGMAGCIHLNPAKDPLCKRSTCAHTKMAHLAGTGACLTKLGNNKTCNCTGFQE